MLLKMEKTVLHMKKKETHNLNPFYCIGNLNYELRDDHGREMEWSILTNVHKNVHNLLLF